MSAPQNTSGDSSQRSVSKSVPVVSASGSKPVKVLNLYAGIGGNRKLWENVEVTAVEWMPEILAVYRELYPNDTVIAHDAHQYLLDHFQEFDFIWSSPPCPTHSRMNTARAGTGMAYRYPDMHLYEEIIFLQNFYDGNWAVENVIGYYEPLIRPVAELDRHYFWSNRHISKARSGRAFAGNLTHATADTLSDSHGIELPADTKNQRKLLRNAVDPILGLHVFNQVNHPGRQAQGTDLVALDLFGTTDVSNPQ